MYWYETKAGIMAFFYEKVMVSGGRGELQGARKMISKAFMAFGAVLSGSVSDSCGLIIRSELIRTRAIDTSYLRNPSSVVSHRVLPCPDRIHEYHLKPMDLTCDPHK